MMKYKNDSAAAATNSSVNGSKIHKLHTIPPQEQVMGTSNIEEGHGGGETSIIPNKPPSNVITSFSQRNKKNKRITWCIVISFSLVAAAMAIMVALIINNKNNDDGGGGKENGNESAISKSPYELFDDPSSVKWKLKGQVIHDPLAIIRSTNITDVETESRSFAHSIALSSKGWLAVGTDRRAEVYLYRWREEEEEEEETEEEDATNGTMTTTTTTITETPTAARETGRGEWYEHTVLEPTAEEMAPYANETEFDGIGIFRSTFSAWGNSVALGDHRLAVGAGARLGRVLTYDYDERDDEWVRHSQPILYMQEGDGTGRSIRLSADGTVMAVGSSRYGVARPSDRRGLIRIFEKPNTVSWTVQGRVTGYESNDKVGGIMHMSVDGRTLISGDFIVNTQNGVGSGMAWVWRRSNDDSRWDLLGSPLPGSTGSTHFGWIVQVSGNVVAVMAYQYKRQRAGIFVYEYVDSATSTIEDADNEEEKFWKLRGDVIEVERNSPTHCLTADGNILVTASASGTGNITVYQYKNENWETVGTFEENADFFRPNSISYDLWCSPDGRTIVIGRPTWSNVGAVSVWEAVEEDE